ENISEHIKEYKIKLNGGDIMLLYTDGLSEAANEEGKMFGDFMPDYLLKYSNLSSKDILNNILGEFQNFLDKTDDVTLLVIKRE
ncbi:MAG TPA: SpoIIE family protein phosphatase, partial [Spirochaetota bacterium]|nr:SpoIIE family protein phosphatase [Spirochaetota bacterium]